VAKSPPLMTSGGGKTFSGPIYIEVVYQTSANPAINNGSYFYVFGMQSACNSCNFTNQLDACQAGRYVHQAEWDIGEPSGGGTSALLHSPQR